MKKWLILVLGTLVIMPVAAKYDWSADLHHRLLIDFNKSREEVKKYIQKYIPDVTESQMDAWEKDLSLEVMELDGQKRYFHNAAPNLFRINPKCKAIKDAKDGDGFSKSAQEDMKNLPEIIQNATAATSHLAAPKRMRVHFTLSVDADAVPAGELLRCWLPFPRTDVPRQKDVRLLGTSEAKYIQSPTSCAHSTIYMEKKAVAGQKTIFSEDFEYTAYGAWFDLKPEDIKPYDTQSKLYKEYTSERESHIIFTPELKALAARLTAGETNPLLKAKKIFAYIDEKFPWASSREYSTVENIPMYVYTQGHGDCGQKTLLFLTLCRICGIPGHFQSGLMLHPGASNLHDWGEIYFEGIGWVPVDQSFGLPKYARNENEKWFFLGGIDSWRMIVNSDYGKSLYPKKKFPRSETVDFQRGEVEWKGGNLYFNQWDYNWKVEYIKE